MPDPANILPQLEDEPASHAAGPLPYKMACLCDIRDTRGRILLVRRRKSPNFGLCSPIGGKLEMDVGESPAQCAQREIAEEAGLRVEIPELRLGGLISEQAFEGRGHWLMFYYRLLRPVEPDEVGTGDTPEGHLEWHRPEEIESLPLPETDRRIIWPLIRRHETSAKDGGPGFFALHIDCRGAELTWTIEEETTV